MMNCTPAVRRLSQPTTRPSPAAHSMASGQTTSAWLLPAQPSSGSASATWLAVMPTT